MNREIFFKKMGVLKGYPDLVKLTEQAYIDLEHKVWKENLEDSPHGRPWHTSFHASQFPSQTRPCGRKAIYTMMDVPNAEPISPFLRGVAEIGKAVEQQIVHRWGFAGLTIGGSVALVEGSETAQIRFADDDTWLTGAADAILDLRPSCDTVLPVDVKSKTTAVLDAMIAGERSYDEKHYIQVQAYIYLCRKYHVEMGWQDLGLKPAESGYIFYSSREDPRKTKEFYVEADYNLINDGIETLHEWKKNFLSGDLPERPKSWYWTIDPCKWCDFKKHVCKPDYKDKVTKIEDSHAMTFTKELRKNYDPEKIKERVLSRWN